MLTITPAESNPCYAVQAGEGAYVKYIFTEYDGVDWTTTSLSGASRYTRDDALYEARFLKDLGSDDIGFDVSQLCAEYIPMWDLNQPALPLQIPAAASPVKPLGASPMTITKQDLDGTPFYLYSQVEDDIPF